ncbi:MAG: DUF4272 domain-containing protein [Peptococcaceae bacterium]|nr:DUF4272 domain-containing protein [Peptococcaceae bacterium]
MEENKKANITLYAVITDFKRIKEILVTQFADVTAEVGNLTPDANGAETFVILFRDGTNLKLRINNNRKYVERHVAGMSNYFSQASCENQTLRQNVLDQIRMFTCVIGGSFELGDENRTNFIMNSMFAVAREISGLVLMPNMCLYDYAGKLVFSGEGLSDLDDYTPIAHTYLWADGETVDNPADLARRDHSLALLQQRGIPFLPNMPIVLTEEESKLRGPEEIARRLLAIFATCVTGEARAGGETWEESQKYIQRADEILGGQLVLSHEERAFLDKKEPRKSDLASFSWRYECCHVLMWALGILDELGYPGQSCDVAGMAKILWQIESLQEFLKSARPCTKSEVLDKADLILRYDWACVDAQVGNREYPAGLDGGVVYEWHRAFNWLIGVNDSL